MAVRHGAVVCRPQSHTEGDSRVTTHGALNDEYTRRTRVNERADLARHSNRLHYSLNRTSAGHIETADWIFYPTAMAVNRLLLVFEGFQLLYIKFDFARPVCLWNEFTTGLNWKDFNVAPRFIGGQVWAWVIAYFWIQTKPPLNWLPATALTWCKEALSCYALDRTSGGKWRHHHKASPLTNGSWFNSNGWVHPNCQQGSTLFGASACLTAPLEVGQMDWWSLQYVQDAVEARFSKSGCPDQRQTQNVSVKMSKLFLPFPFQPLFSFRHREPCHSYVSSIPFLRLLSWLTLSFPFQQLSFLTGSKQK